MSPPPAPGPVLVLCPMQIEEAAVVRAVRAAGAHTPIRVVRTGIGKDAILAALVRELAAAVGAGGAVGGAEGHAPSLVILAGACGGLRPTADVPSISRIIDEHGHTWPRGIGFDPAGVTLVAVDRIIATPQDKAALAAATGAAIVDMESHAFAAACETRGLAWSVIRGVSDTPDESLPAEVLAWITPDGRTRSLRAFLDLLRRPWLIPHIIRLLRRSNRVLPKVGEAALALASAPLTTQRGPGASPGFRQPPAPCAAAFHPALPPVALTHADVVIFGGTFDPVHIGHTSLADHARRHVEARSRGFTTPPPRGRGRGVGESASVLSEPPSTAGASACLLLIPAARSPHKDSAPHATDADRVAMLRIAIADAPTTAVWTVELEQGSGGAAPSFTIDTLRRARAALNAAGRHDSRLHLLIGADQALALHRWREPHEILALAHPLILLRGEHAAADALAAALAALGFWSDAELARLRAGIVPAPLVNVSSTAVREALAAGRDTTGMLDPRVRAYIDQHGLYR
ncbi:MAG: adenylyltransferase/cytidyltransferase family protein [Phycisphaerales bacterium]